MGTAGQAGRAGAAMWAKSQGLPAVAGRAESSQCRPQQLLNLQMSGRFWKLSMVLAVVTAVAAAIKGCACSLAPLHWFLR